MLITQEQLGMICKRLSPARAEDIADYINKICPLYGINSSDILHEFLANVITECGEFTVYEENLRYSAKRLTEVWPKRFPTIASAQPYAFNPSQLAAKVYGNRKDLGNITSADGWTFRGSGMIQNTGRKNTTMFGNYMKNKFGIVHKPEEWAVLLRTSDEYAMHNACYIFAIAKQLIDEAVDDNMDVIIKRINGGYTGRKERMEYLRLCRKFVP